MHAIIIMLLLFFLNAFIAYRIYSNKCPLSQKKRLLTFYEKRWTNATKMASGHWTFYVFVQILSQEHNF